VFFRGPFLDFKPISEAINCSHKLKLVPRGGWFKGFPTKTEAVEFFQHERGRGSVRKLLPPTLNLVTSVDHKDPAMAQSSYVYVVYSIKPRGVCTTW
jgi:hypothetical protein